MIDVNEKLERDSHFIGDNKIKLGFTKYEFKRFIQLEDN